MPSLYYILLHNSMTPTLDKYTMKLEHMYVSRGQRYMLIFLSLGMLRYQTQLIRSTIIIRFFYKMWQTLSV